MKRALTLRPCSDSNLIRGTTHKAPSEGGASVSGEHHETTETNQDEGIRIDKSRIKLLRGAGVDSDRNKEPLRTEVQRCHSRAASRKATGLKLCFTCDQSHACNLEPP